MTNRDLKLSEFYESLGYALVQWQSIEYQCELLFRILADSKDNAYASTIFHSVFGFAPRLKMIHDLMGFRFQKKMRTKNKWKRISENIHDAYDSRNKLAHWQFQKRSNGEWSLAPAFSDPRPTRSREFLTTIDLKEIAVVCHLVHGRLSVFRSEIENEIASPGKRPVR